jgi:recombination protein RecT
MKNELTVKDFFARNEVKSKFEQLLGKKSVGFVTSVLQITSQNALLSKANPMSIFNASAMAATLDLPINQNLGFAYIVPYNEKYKDAQGQWQSRCNAQFQIGWKGLVQLAQRSGQYTAINVVEVYENQFKSYNALTEELKADFETDGDGKVVGYVAYFRLLNGFEKTCYWSIAKVEKHAQKYSKTYANNNSAWKTDFDAMAKKTVLKNTISKWGILSIEMQSAVVADQAIINDVETLDVTYSDAGESTIIETKETISDDELIDVIENIKSRNITLEALQIQYDVTDEQIKTIQDATV